MTFTILFLLFGLLGAGVISILAARYIKDRILSFITLIVVELAYILWLYEILEDHIK